MKIKTHLRVAKIAAREYALARRAAAAFYLGTMVPDILPFYHPHYYKTSAGYVFQKLGKLAKKHTTLSFFLRGVMAHYVTDFCCSAHADGLGNVKEHIAYEWKLEKYTKTHLKELKQKYREREKITDLHEALNAYIGGGIKNDCENDFCSAVQSCVALLGCYTPVADICRRAISLDFDLATPIDELADAITDALNDTISDVVRTNHGSA